MFVPELSELYICGRITILGMNPIVPEDGYFLYNLRPMSDQRSDEKGIPGLIWFYFRLKFDQNLKFLTAKFLNQCYRVLQIFHLSTKNKC